MMTGSVLMGKEVTNNGNLYSNSNYVVFGRCACWRTICKLERITDGSDKQTGGD